MEFLKEVIFAIAGGSGFAALDWKTVVMLVIACVLLYMGIGKGFEPLLLVPIAFGMLLANLPITGLFAEPVYDAATHSGTVGFMWVLYQGVQYAIYPSIIFMGIGAMTDFGPLLANPMSLLLGAAAQLGIFAAFLMALVLGFTPAEAAAIGVLLADTAVKAATVDVVGYSSPANGGTSFSNEVILTFTGDSGAVKQAIIAARDVGMQVLKTLEPSVELKSTTTPYIL